MIHEKLPSRLEAIPDFLQNVSDKLTALSLSQEEVFNIKLALQEAMVNAVKHGNKSDPHLSVVAKVEANTQRVVIEIVNEGEGFDAARIPDPTRSENLLKTSGRGLFLIRKLMDEVVYFDCGRGIRMIKSLKKEAHGEDPRGKD